MENIIDPEIELDFKQKQNSMKELMPGQKAQDKIIIVKKYKQLCFEILDTTKVIIENRLLPYMNILKDKSLLDSKKFATFKEIDTFWYEVLNSTATIMKNV